MAENNAPSPEVMTEELINIGMHYVPAADRQRMRLAVDAMLEKQMSYYAQMAESEIDTSSTEAAMVAGELVGVANAVINQGAQYVDFMNEQQRHMWQFQAERLRTSCRKLVDLIR